MGRVFVQLEEGLLLLECAHKVELTKLHLINLQGGFNAMLDVNVWFGVGIFIYNYFEYLLICPTTREYFGR